VRLKIRDSDPPVGDEVLSEIEGRLGLVFPADYRSFLLMHNGGVPRPGWFLLRHRGRWPSALRSRGSLRWLGQKYGNESMRERRGD